MSLRAFTSYGRMIGIGLAGAALAATAACSQTSTTSPSSSSAAPTPSLVSGTGLPPGFVRLASVDSSILQEMRYATNFNFVGKPIDGYDKPECWLTQDAANALAKAQIDARQAGFTLKVYDCYRPQSAVDEFVAWANDPAATKMKNEYYPHVEKSQLIPDGYIAEKSGHSRGSTVDVTLVPLPGKTSPPWTPEDGLRDCTAPSEFRTPDTSINMGTGFDCFDPLSATASPEVDETIRERRQQLVTLLSQHGFTNLPEEWWHFSLQNEPYPTTYFNNPIA